MYTKDEKVSVTKIMVDFIVALGAAAEDALLLTGDEYGEIIQFVLGSKKN